MVSFLRKVAPTAVAPTEMPRKSVTMFINAFWAVSERRSVTPVSFRRFPNIRQPSSPATEGSSITVNTVTMMGKMIFSVLETSLSCPILIARSFLGTMRRISGG